ncbi:MAG TPA: hypothetical protein VFP84_19905 [Kofleriaceae bacterium]|nr:hypothetical protein [Kofleriaceae bacterium]
MDRARFAHHLHRAAIATRDLARTVIAEPLPDELRFRVLLNSWYYDYPPEDDVDFPDDGTHATDRALAACTEDQVCEVLWRAGRVPAWIDLEVIDETGAATLIEVKCSGRFLADEAALHHGDTGHPPFRVRPPFPPHDAVAGARFTIHQRGEHWTWAELARLPHHAGQLGFLRLLGHELDDRALHALPVLPRLSFLELWYSALRGPGLAALARQPALRSLRLDLDPELDPDLDPDLGAFSLADVPPLPQITSFELNAVPSHDWGMDQLARVFPALDSLILRAPDELRLSAAIPASVSSLFLHAAHLTGALHLPAELATLSLAIAGATPDQLDTWLAGVRQLDALLLRGTAITDAFAEALPDRFGLSRLHLADTPVSPAALARIAARHPALRVRTRVLPRAYP